MSYESREIIEWDVESKITVRPLCFILMGTELIWLYVPMSEEIITSIYKIDAGEISCYAP
jgi:hypothetical protein